MFETFSIKFINRKAFCIGIAILKTGDYDEFFYDIGHADMLISFDNKTVLDAFVFDCLFWGAKNAADFTINQ